MDNYRNNVYGEVKTKNAGAAIYILSIEKLHINNRGIFLMINSIQNY